MIDIIANIMSVAKALLGLKDKLAQADRRKRVEIANYFDNLNKCLKAVHESLSRGEVPHGRCKELETYADLLPQTIGQDIGQDKAKELSQKLHAAHEVEGLYYLLHQATDRAKQLAQIEEASGLFVALATSVRAGLKKP